LSTPTISRHEVQIFRELLNATEWLSTSELAEQAGVSPRTARAHVTKLVGQGIAERAEVFPGYRYRIAQRATGNDWGRPGAPPPPVVAYLGQLRNAATALGIRLPDGRQG
jgi:predicted ArsR family transcriptional regulator